MFCKITYENNTKGSSQDFQCKTDEVKFEINKNSDLIIRGEVYESYGHENPYGKRVFDGFKKAEIVMSRNQLEGLIDYLVAENIIKISIA